MIKLIASDLDGTLLDGSRRLPKDFYPVLKRLKAMGVRFIAASGRSFHTLRRDFAPYADEMLFISDNGARITAYGEVLEKSPISPEVVRLTVDCCREIPDVAPILCGDEGTYANVKEDWFHDSILQYFNDYTQTSDFGAITEDLYKISICDKRNPAKNSFLKAPQILRDKADLQVSGDIWLDVMQKGVNKSVGLRAFQRRYGVTKEETMVFGDFYNDSQMLLEAKYSFVMENANEDMKCFGNFIAPGNDEDGVMRMIKKYVFGEEG